MRLRWRLPLVLSAVIVAAQVRPVDPLLDVVRSTAPAGLTLQRPVTHVLFAPFTVTADWLNGGSRADLKGFVIWALVGFVLVRLGAQTRGRADAQTRRRAGARGEMRAALVFLLAFGAFIWWGTRWNRPIPRLHAEESSLLIFDTHAHTSASHDGRPGFGAAANARWHARAGFDAAFITDHNVAGAAKEWQRDRAGHPPRLLEGEELSLSGLHVVVLGNTAPISNTPWNESFDSSLALLSAIGNQQSAYLIASLPEFWEHHWGPDLGRLVESGIQGFEIWVSSPKAMDLPPADRRTLIDRARIEHLALFGATDMHGLGNTASVWNVMRLPGWQQLSDSALSGTMIAAFRADPSSIQVIALRRFEPGSRIGAAFGVPMGLFTAVRAASPLHAVSFILWIWLAAIVAAGREVTGTEMR